MCATNTVFISVLSERANVGLRVFTKYRSSERAKVGLGVFLQYRSSERAKVGLECFYNTDQVNACASLTATSIVLSYI